MTRKVRLSLASVALALMLGGAAARAQILGPSTPGDVVDVGSNFGSADCVNVGRKFDTRLGADGSETPFAIPAGQVLVVTAIEILGFGAGPGQTVQTRIFRGVDMTVNEVAIRESAADAGGRIFHIYAFDPGVVVASGGEVCTNNNLNIPTVGTMRGYLAPQ